MANKPIKHRILSQDAEIREGIKAPDLIELLTNHCFGRISLNQSQTSAAKILLAKCLPDIQMVQVDLSGGLTVEVLQVASHKPVVKKRASKAASK